MSQVQPMPAVAVTSSSVVAADEQAIHFIGLVEKPRQDPVSAALELIEEQSRKVSYDSKAKWLKLTGDAKLLRAICTKMRSDNRRKYGTMGHNRDMRLQMEEDGWMLYVHANR